MCLVTYAAANGITVEEAKLVLSSIDKTANATVRRVHKQVLYGTAWQGQHYRGRGAARSVPFAYSWARRL